MGTIKGGIFLFFLKNCPINTVWGLHNGIQQLMPAEYIPVGVHAVSIIA
jgi:hypothetical protein